MNGCKVIAFQGVGRDQDRSFQGRNFPFVSIIILHRIKVSYIVRFKETRERRKNGFGAFSWRRNEDRNRIVRIFIFFVPYAIREG